MYALLITTPMYRPLPGGGILHVSELVRDKKKPASKREGARANARARTSGPLYSRLLSAALYCCPFSLAPMVIWGNLCSSIFLLIYFINHYSILLGTNKVAVVVSCAALA